MSDVQLDSSSLTPWPIAPVTGGKVALGDVVGRDDFIVEVLEQLRAGNNVLIVDPRRMGKTTVLARLCNEPGSDFEAVFVDLEGADTIEECFSRLVHALQQHDAIWRRVKNAVRAHVDTVDVTRGSVTIKAVMADRSAVDVLGDVVSAVDKRLNGESNLIIAIDELPMAVESIMRHGSADMAAQLLHRLRHLRQSTTSIRWILAGSIGFHHVVREVGSTEGVIGDLYAASPGPLDPGWAEFLAKCLFLGIGRDAEPDAAAAMADVAGGIPYVIHHVAHRLKGSSGPIDADEVRAEFVNFARDRDASRAMTHLLSRLDGKDLHRLLDLFAMHGELGLSDVTKLFTIAGQAVERDPLLEMLDLLCDDHYLRRLERGFAWKYDVLRRIWVIRRELDQ